jgi:hypothetical protein
MRTDYDVIMSPVFRTLLQVFPLDFGVIPDPLVAATMPTVTMVLIKVELGISTIVRFVPLMIHVSRSSSSPPAGTCRVWRRRTGTSPGLHRRRCSRSPDRRSRV